MNVDFRNYILNLVDISKSEVIYDIYFEMYKVLEYDYNYFFYDKEAIINKDIGLINLTDNKVTCYTFSLIYKDILEFIGIESEIICNGEHFYVEVFGLSADSCLFGENAIEFALNDLSRVKLGLTPMFCRDNYYNVINIDNCFYKSIVRKFKKLLKFSEIDFVINYAINICNCTTLFGIEKLSLMKGIFINTFENSIISFIMFNDDLSLSVYIDNNVYVINSNGFIQYEVDDYLANNIIYIGDAPYYAVKRM